MPTEPYKPIIFISYAHPDEPERPSEGEVKWLSFVTDYLQPAVKRGAVEIWTDRLMPGGEDWDPEIERKVRQCDIFILLVSRHSTASDYIIDREIGVVRERQAKGDDVHFYPLLLTPTPRAGLELVRDKNLRPRDARPLSSYSLHDRQQHMSDAADEIAAIAAQIAAGRNAPPPSPAPPQTAPPPRYGAPKETEPEARDRQSLETWLTRQPREVALAIGARAALRVAPLAAGERQEGWRRGGFVFKVLTIAAFQSVARARVATKYPTRSDARRAAGAGALATAGAGAFAAFGAAAAAIAAAKAATRAADAIKPRGPFIAVRGIDTGPVVEANAAAAAATDAADAADAARAAAHACAALAASAAGAASVAAYADAYAARTAADAATACAAYARAAANATLFPADANLDARRRRVFQGFREFEEADPAAALRAILAAEAGKAAAWKEVRNDIVALERFGPSALADEPLWSERAPKWAQGAWADLRAALPIGEDWEVWIDWYEERLRGGSRGEAYELVFASVQLEVSARGPAAANAWIREHLP